MIKEQGGMMPDGLETKLYKANALWRANLNSERLQRKTITVSKLPRTQLNAGGANDMLLTESEFEERDIYYLCFLDDTGRIIRKETISEQQYLTKLSALKELYQDMMDEDKENREIQKRNNRRWTEFHFKNHYE